MLLQIASAQYPVGQHPSFDEWRVHTAHWVSEAAHHGAKLLLFPEYGSMELVSLMPEEVQKDLKLQLFEMRRFYDDFCSVYAELARQYKVIIVAPSFPVVQPSGKVYNRAGVFSQQGMAGWQDKLMMTRFENEHWGIQQAPPSFSLFEAAWGSFGIQICYDVEFPIGTAALCRAGASLILAPSCTETLRGSTRVHVGARARALENQCYTVVSPLVGEAPWLPAVDVNYGHATAYSSPDTGLPEEGVVATMPANQPGWLQVHLDLKALETVRSDGQVLNYRDHQQLNYGLHGKTPEVQRFPV